MLKIGVYDRMGTVADASFPARLTTTTNMLNNTVPNLFNQYQTMLRNSASLTKQNSGLQSQVNALKSKLKDIEKISETYDREFLDRTAINKRGFFQAFGVYTMQDWLVLIFFVLYSIICFSILCFVLIKSTQKLVGALIVIGFSIFIGLMLIGIIMRFA
jgi:hypothetical protein